MGPLAWSLEVAACASVVMDFEIWRRAALMFSSVKVGGFTVLGHYSHLPQEEELDQYGEELSHW